MRQAACCLAIGEDMAEAYAAWFGRPFDHFQNAIELHRWEHYRKRDLHCHRPARQKSYHRALANGNHSGAN